MTGFFEQYEGEKEEGKKEEFPRDKPKRKLTRAELVQLTACVCTSLGNREDFKLCGYFNGSYGDIKPWSEKEMRTFLYYLESLL